MESLIRKSPYQTKDFKYVILDNDGGCDDCQAIVALDYFIKQSGKTLLGITCCNGNTDLKNVALNVLISQKICNSSYPIYIGNDFNISGENLKDNFFGQDGLGCKQKFYLNEFNISESLDENKLVKR
jgi:inosine-uridine nucleoside N-ribohydrolase